MGAKTLACPFPKKMNQRVEIRRAVGGEASIVADVKERMRIDAIRNAEKHVMAVGVEPGGLCADLLPIEAVFEKRRKIYVRIRLRQIMTVCAYAARKFFSNLSIIPFEIEQRRRTYAFVIRVRGFRVDELFEPGRAIDPNFAPL
ncbi:hypothetical protein [Methyloferula stellata]|uniref:hypothetical protein n=1 Tax=Methyloferula stellata TaxID=876270 RepID=UPI00137545CC|nr:hypothetical protein [Methyloferula stellata]